MGDVSDFDRIPKRVDRGGLFCAKNALRVPTASIKNCRYDEDSRKFYLPSEDDESSKLTEVHFCSVSHSWEAMEHPDPWRDQLRAELHVAVGPRLLISRKKPRRRPVM